MSVHITMEDVHKCVLISPLATTAAVMQGTCSMQMELIVLVRDSNECCTGHTYIERKLDGALLTRI